MPHISHIASALFLSALLVLTTARPAGAQQRPLVTEDPESIGAGRILIEGGVDLLRGQLFSVSGLDGNVLRIPTLGASIGVSSIAEVQIDGGFERLSITKRRPAPLAALVDVPGTSTSTFEDLVIATKIRFAAEGPGRPGFGVRFATKIPMATTESGLGLETTDFFASLLVGKTTQSVRVVGNAGFGILGNPAEGTRHNTVLTYGVSVARAVSNRSELVGEINGRGDIAGGEGAPPPGTENRAAMRLGARFTQGTVRLDGGIIVGFTSRDPGFGVTAGFTYVFNAFRVP